MRKSIVWIPVLLMGSMLYWTLALGFGGLSLMSVTSNAVPCPEGAARDSFQSITVNLGDSLDLAGQQPGALTVDLISDEASVEPSAEVVPRGDSAGTTDVSSGEGLPEARGSGRRSRSDRGPGETAF